MDGGGLTCKYTNKKCFNPRTHKRDGSLHTLCELHRQRINVTQRSYSQRRQMKHRFARRQVVLERQQSERSTRDAIVDTYAPSLDAILYDDDEDGFEPIFDDSERVSWSPCDYLVLQSLLL
ncbi:hypothetical protein AC1031_003617 [Aphanomyces cochlioides]|nr:hypothetical protein AC1031_003617 [Aphanomyces cochlioides]